MVPSTVVRIWTMTTVVFVMIGWLGAASSSLRTGRSPPSAQGWSGIERVGTERSSSEEAAVLPYGHKYEGGPRALLQTRNPECTMPEEDPCVINTTAIGMVESGYATYYDDTCAAAGYVGCYTEDVPECRTCFLSVELYMASTNISEKSVPLWGDCPCCVPTTLASEHPDIEVVNFNYSVFDISAASCTDAPTQAPAVTPTPSTVTTSLSLSSTSVTPAPSLATSFTPAPTTATPASMLESPLPTPATTPAPMSTPSPATFSSSTDVRGDGTSSISSPSTVSGTPEPSMVFDVGSENAVNEDDGDDGLSTGTKIGIGVGVGVGVMIIGLAGFGALKAFGRI